MSVISVYRTFYWTKERLAGQTGYTWETKEEQARCIKEPPKGLLLTSGVTPTSFIPPTEEQQRQNARYHIAHQQCLCGIFGYFSPNHLGLLMVSGTGPGAVDRDGEMVFARVRLGGLVDIHGLGARGEYGLIEEAWCDETDIAEAIAKQYDIPVNKSEYKGQPRTDPILSGEAKIIKMAPLFADMPEALGVQNALGLTPGPAVGIQTVITPTMINQARATLGNSSPAAQLFGQPLTYKQYMNMMAGNPPPPIPSPFGALGRGPLPSLGLGGGSVTPGFAFSGPTGRLAPGGPPPQPGGFGPPPPWTSQQMRSLYNAKHNPPAQCSVPPGSNCQCGACSGALWQCSICKRYEPKASDHTWRKCAAALPKLLPVPGSIGVDKAYKPGIITRISRALNGWRFWP